MANTTVDLYSKELDTTVAHDLEHANRIFAYKHAHGWELKDKNFTQNKDGVIVRRSKSESSEADKQGSA